MTIIILIISDHFSSSSHSIENWNECKNIIRYCWCWSAGHVICTWACACDGAGQSDEESPSALHFSVARFNDCGIYWYCSFFILSSPRNYSYFYSNSSSPLNSSDSSHFWDLGFYIELVIYSMYYWQYWNVTLDSQHVLRMLSSGLPEALQPVWTAFLFRILLPCTQSCLFKIDSIVCIHRFGGFFFRRFLARRILVFVRRFKLPLHIK